MGKSWRDEKDFDRVRFKPKKKLRVKIRPEKVLIDRYLMEIDKNDQENK